MPPTGSFSIFVTPTLSKRKIKKHYCSGHAAYKLHMRFSSTMKAWVTTIQLRKQIREECSTLGVRPVLETVLVVLYAKLAVK